MDDLIDFADGPTSRECSPIPRRMGHGFNHFEWIPNVNLALTDLLARSSAPHYDCKDSDQDLTDDSVEFLKEHSITNVISVNSEAINPAIRDKLKANGIAYTPIPVKDMKTPTIEQLMQGYQAFRKSTNGATLIWCGYGHGRTGTMVSAIEMLRAAELQLHHYFLPDNYKARHVEAKEQVKTLNKLQNFLEPLNVKRQIAEFQPIVDDAQASVQELKANKQKPSSEVKSAQSKLGKAVSTLEDLETALDIQWQIDRVWFDRSLALLAQTKVTEPPSPQTLIDCFHDTKEHVGVLLGDNAGIQAFADYIKSTAESLKDLMRTLGVAAGIATPETESAASTPSSEEMPSDDETSQDKTKDEQASANKEPLPQPAQKPPADITAQIRVIEDYRKRVHDMFTFLQTKVQDIRHDVEHVRDETMGRLQLQGLNADLLGFKRTIKDHASKGMSTKVDSKIFYAALQQVDEIASNAYETAWNAAKLVNDNERFRIQDYETARAAVHEIRIKLAEMMGFQAKQYATNYVRFQWQRAQGSKAQAEEEATMLEHVVRQLIKPASDLGTYLEEKMKNAKTIKNIFDFAKKGASSDMIEYDAPVGVSTTGTMWLNNKETAHQALQHELDTLSAEIQAMKGPTVALITITALGMQETQIAQAVLANVDEAEKNIMEWRKEAIREVIDAMDKEAQDEIEAKQDMERRQRIEAEDRRLVAERGRDWKIELAIDIGLALLAAGPNLPASIAEGILWARQALRIIRYLRNAISEEAREAEGLPAHASEQGLPAHTSEEGLPGTAEKGDLTSQAQQVRTRLTRSLKEWKIAAPTNTQQWAQSKAPNQVFEGLVGLRDAGVKPTKSIEELIEDLDALEVPSDEPGDPELDEPLEDLRQDLKSPRVPIRLPKKAKLPELAHLRAPRDYQSLRQDLKRAASIPHHSSDVAFKQLIEEAAAYLPAECDIKRNSMAFKVVEFIRMPAVAA
ncbi:hypothetical protein CDD82_354 [Ophiocordyceps australis]|uniref:Swiss Army Knife protein DSP-PTPase phosphatase domain-containing protein n=1 Tax=Ophiocordyceps australis TaxID=1399860 RepID=A0A2C5ZQA3_9HYPO|nr:hypothetical protein CDD82_354 [Ophiocordyceps australis]